MKKLFVAASVLALAPAVAFARPLGSFREFISFAVDDIIGGLIKLIFALAVIVFLWGVFQFIRNADDATKRAEGRQFMLWGIIGLFVFVAFWSLVGLLANTFQVPLQTPSAPNPTIQI